MVISPYDDLKTFVPGCVRLDEVLRSVQSAGHFVVDMHTIRCTILLKSERERGKRTNTERFGYHCFSLGRPPGVPDRTNDSDGPDSQV